MAAVRISKRRALVARLFACVVPVLLLAASSAPAAVPDVPRLVTTNPPSSGTEPAKSLTPTILGEAEPKEVVVIESFPFAMRSLGGRAPRAGAVTKNPTFEIQVFNGARCPGSPIATGNAETFETTGIPLTVPADSVTTFSAIQVDPGPPAESSGCSNPLIYWEGNVAAGGSGGGSSGGSEGGAQPSGGSSSAGAVGPAAPAGGKPDAPRIHTQPGARANNMSPSVLGSAPGASAVAVYASANCSGTPIAQGTPVQLSAGFQVTVAPNAETTFSAVSIGGLHSSCSSPVTYTEDSTAPRTRVTMGPGVKTRKHSAVFRFKDITSDPPGTTFVCKVDKGKWKPCASPFHAKHLKLGNHVVQIRATDLAGNVERHPVKRRFRVVPPA